MPTWTSIANPQTCRCKCLAHIQCPAGQYITSFTCQCKCFHSLEPRPGFEASAFSTGFVPGAQRFNPNNCTCECPVSVMISCPGGQDSSPVKCRCEFAPPTTLYTSHLLQCHHDSQPHGPHHHAQSYAHHPL